MHLILVHSIRFQTGPEVGQPGRELDLDALDVKKHLTIKYKETTVNWDSPIESEQFKSRDLPAKKCDLNDFTTGEQDPIAERFYKDWMIYTTICPDFTNHPKQSFVLTGDTSS